MPADVERINGLLDRFGLPRSAPLDDERVLAKLGSDKKRVSGRQRYILPSKGGVVVRDDVPETAVRDLLATVNVRGGEE